MSWKVWRCRWCGRRVHGLFRLFHNPEKCPEKTKRIGGDK